VQAIGPVQDPRLIVGFDTADDAGVVRLGDGRCLIQTLDFFTPIADDPYTFGAIAAVNALSDVYAMGGAPMTAMNIVCWPHKDLPPEVLGEILRGGADKVREAGALLVGGHSVTDKELKYGLSVTGIVEEDQLWTNAGAAPGQLLLLTKPVGTGVLSTAVKRGACPPEAEAASVASMLTLNRAACEAARPHGVTGCTDITGYGLVGHAWELARASRVRLVIEAAAVPLLPEVLALAAAGHLTRGEKSNRAYVGDALEWVDVPAPLQSALVDPQTSGGLLMSLPEAGARALAAAGVGAIIGRVEAGLPGLRIVGG
jgi:selenide,water dikinase